MAKEKVNKKVSDKRSNEKRSSDRKRLGATRVDKKESRSFQFPWRLLAWLIVPTSLAVGLFFAFDRYDPMLKLQGFVNKPIAKVNVEGEFKSIGRNEAQILVNEFISNTFFELDIKGLQRGVEQHPWVDRVSVRRQWPDTLVVQIKEQKAIARWGDEHFLNARGDVISLLGNENLSHLPLLKGSDRYAKNIMQQYLIFAKLLAPHELNPEEIVLDDTLSWSVTIPDSILIKLGRENVHEKLQKLTFVLQTYLSKEKNKISVIDMRYENGFAVEWQNQLLETASSKSAVQKNKRGG